MATLRSSKLVPVGEAVDAVAVPLRAGRRVDARVFAAIRRRMVLEFCKWDPQVEDVGTLADFPVVMARGRWDELAGMAEELAREMMEAEERLRARPELHSVLGLPRGHRRMLRKGDELGWTPSACRAMRFDFHWTDEGWRISEVNSDVPGGYTEASELPRLMAEAVGGVSPAGHPGAAVTDALRARAGGKRVALMSAAGFIEDQQVVAYLGGLLSARGVGVELVGPRGLEWVGGVARLVGNGEEVGAVVRFYQAEWLDAKRDAGMFVGGRTPVMNPGVSMLTESKRFPLVWEKLGLEMATWRRLLPETRDPRDAPWREDDGWLVKSAFCNTGDTVVVRGEKGASGMGGARWRARGWVAQRRFRTLSLETPMGEVYPCIGVYVVDGRAAGVYGRLGRTPVINYSAVDVAVLVEGTC